MPCSLGRGREGRSSIARLRGALFPDADLDGASLEAASAPNSVWTGAKLRGAKLSRMDGSWGVYRNADLEGADVAGACLASADIHGVRGNLAEADLSDARGTVDWRAAREREAVPDRPA